jgi:hypothetical protein
MNTRNFRNALALPALIAVGLLGNTAPISAQPMVLQHPAGSWLYGDDRGGRQSGA